MTRNGPDIGDVLRIVNPGHKDASAIVMAVEDDGSLVVQVADGSVLVLEISPMPEEGS